MSAGLDRIRERMTDYLRQKGVPARTAWPVEGREELAGPAVLVSLRGCRAQHSGFQDYLGERFDPESGRWEELYGRKAQLTFGLDLCAPAKAGEGALQDAFDRLAQALLQGGPQGLEVLEFSCGETGWDREGRLLRCSAQAICSACLTAAAQADGSFLDFEIRGEGNL